MRYLQPTRYGGFNVKSEPASMMLEENRLRAYMKCPAYFNFGGTTELPLRVAILEFVYIRVLLEALRNDNFDFRFTLNRTIGATPRALKLEDYLTKEEQREHVASTSVLIHDIYNQYLPIHKYIPAFGPYEFKIGVSHSYLNARVAGLLVNHIYQSVKGINDSSRTIHGVTFSPYSNIKDMENDIIQHIKVMSLAKANPLEERAKLQSKIHIFGLSRTNELLYTYVVWDGKQKKGWGKYLTHPIEQIEQKYDYPLTPCPYSCPYKGVCKPQPDRRHI